MPGRTHQGHTPPSWWDRPLSHPWSLTIVGMFWTVTGVRLFTMIAKSSAGEDGVVAHVPVGLGLWLATSVTIGGALVILAVIWQGEDDRPSWVTEMIGLTLGAGAWGVYAFAQNVDPSFRDLAVLFVVGASLRVTTAVVNRERWARRAARGDRRMRLRLGD